MAASEDQISSRKPRRSSPGSTASASGVYFIVGEHPSGRRLKVPVHPGLAPLTQGLRPDLVTQGSPSDRPLRLSPVGPDKEILCLERCGQAGSDRRPQPKVGPKLETSRGTFLLVTPFWDAQTWFASFQALAVEDVRSLLMSADLVIDLMTGEPPPILDRLFLVVWTISGGVGASTPSQTDRSISSRQDGSDLQKSAMSVRGSPSRTSFALPPFHSIRPL
jgi:hypothetical protein